MNVRKIRMGMDILPTIVNDGDDVERGDAGAEVDAFDELIGADAAAAPPPRPTTPESDPEQPTTQSPAQTVRTET